MTASKHRTISNFLCGSLCWLSAGCSAAAGESVTPRFDVRAQSKSALSAADLNAVTGTYGGGCDGRSGMGTDPWTLMLSGGSTDDELSVRKNDSDCVLTIKNVVIAGGIYVGAPSIALDTTNTYQESAAAFAINGEALAFYGNAKISSLTFAENFTISLLISDIPRIGDGARVRARFAQDGSVPDLLTAKSFAVLAGSTITNSGGGTLIIGNLGLSPGTSVTGMPAGQPMGATYVGSDAVAEQAQADLTTLYNDLAGRTCPAANELTGQDLAGQTILPGVYCFASSAALGVGNLTLDAKNDPNAYWVFQIGSTLTVSASTLSVTNGGTPCNVFWQVGSSATVLDNALFAGNLVALTSITLNTGASVSPGRTFARNGAVTMLSNHVSTAACP